MTSGREHKTRMLWLAGLLHAFMDGSREVTTADIVARAGQIQPTSVVKREQVESLRRWAKDHLALDAGGNGVAPLSSTSQAERASSPSRRTPARWQ